MYARCTCTHDRCDPGWTPDAVSAPRLATLRAPQPLNTRQSTSSRVAGGTGYIWSRHYARREGGEGFLCRPCKSGMVMHACSEMYEGWVSPVTDDGDASGPPVQL